MTDVHEDKDKIICFPSFVMEMFGSFCLCYFGGLAVIHTDGIAVAFVHGLILFFTIHIGGDISGAHFNPAVSITFIVTGMENWIKMLIYIAFQIIGSILAGSLLLIKANTDKTGMGYPRPGPNTNLLAVFIFETIATFLLLVGIFVNIKRKQNATMTGLFVGIAVFIDILTVGEDTGASMNPIRALGPSIIDGDPFFYGFWIYLTAPILGALLGALYHEFVIKQKKSLYREKTIDINRVSNNDINDQLMTTKTFEESI